MSSPLGAWGVPDFGSTVQRERILTLMAREGTRPVVLSGPPGRGKTIAAAHHSLSIRRSVVWMDACGAFLAAERVARSIVNAVAGSSPVGGQLSEGAPQLVDLIEATLATIECAGGGTGICVVVDDLGQPTTDSSMRDLGRLARSLRRCSSQLVITTRSISGWPLDMLCDWEVVSQSDLALTLDEAESLLRSAGHEVLVADAGDMSEACGGHAAIFAVLARQAARNGVAATVSRNVTLDAWLERQLMSSLPAEHVTALLLAALLKSGTEIELERLGIPDAGVALDALDSAIPLVACSRDDEGVRRFRVHDLLDGFLHDKLNVGQLVLPVDSHQAVADVLTDRGDLVRAAAVLGRAETHNGLAVWLDENGRRLLSTGCYRQLERLVGQLRFMS